MFIYDRGILRGGLKFSIIGNLILDYEFSTVRAISSSEGSDTRYKEGLVERKRALCCYNVIYLSTEEGCTIIIV